ELRDRGAQVRLLASATATSSAAPQRPAPPPDVAPPPPESFPRSGANRLPLLFAMFVCAALAYVNFAPLARPLPPPVVPSGGEAPLFPAQLDPAPHRLNNEAVELNAAGQFADAAGKLREALARAPEQEAIKRNLKTVLHNWAVAELNANHNESAEMLLEQ